MIPYLPESPETIVADVYIVVPFHATGSSTHGTRRFTWKVADGSRGYRQRNVAGVFPGTDEGMVAALELAEELTRRNEEF